VWSLLFMDGDVGLAVYLWDCLTGEPSFSTIDVLAPGAFCEVPTGFELVCFSTAVWVQALSDYPPVLQCRCRSRAFPYPGVTTTPESLWMGVPVLTRMGDRLLSRLGVSILTNAGLPEWIATDADDYVARAVLHAAYLDQLATLRTGLRQRVLASSLFDSHRFANHFEDALRGMWTKWCNQQRGEIFAQAPNG
jgi:hypothetical protein